MIFEHKIICKIFDQLDLDTHKNQTDWATIKSFPLKSCLGSSNEEPLKIVF